MDIELIINSVNTDALQKLREGVARLRADGQSVQARITFEQGDATRFAREATERGTDLVISAGGDGTLNEVVNGIAEAHEFGHTPAAARGADKLPRVGIVPLGTGNDFASFIGTPTDVAEALAFAIDGPSILADLGVLNGRYFANVSSGGLGAEATEEASDRAKRLLGSVAYLVTGVRTFATLSPSQGRFASDGDLLFDGPFLFFAVGNGRRAGGGNWITPSADLTDGLLDVCIVREMGRAELLRLLPELRAGRHLENKHVIYKQVRTLRVEPKSALSVNMDGEAVSGPVLEYSVAPGALRIAAAV